MIQGLPKTARQWLLLLAGAVSGPVLTCAKAWAMGAPVTWTDLAHGVVLSLVALFAGWLMPELRRETGLDPPPIDASDWSNQPTTLSERPEIKK